jgi:hypothetical protein
MVQFPAMARDFSLLNTIHTGSGVHPSLYTMNTAVSFFGCKEAGA